MPEWRTCRFGVLCARTMLRWNPLYVVTLVKESLKFENELGFTELKTEVIGIDARSIHDKLVKGIDTQLPASIDERECDILRAFLRKKLVVNLPTGCSIENLDRSAGHFMTFSVDPIDSIQRVRDATVCILGLGGVGTIVLQHLVAAGVQQFVLVDSDIVEPSNLNRQFIYKAADIGKNKVDICTDFIRTRVPNAIVVTHHRHIGSELILHQLDLPMVDLVVNCLDTPHDAVDDLIHLFGEQTRTPVIGAGVGVYYGHWGPLLAPGETPTYAEWKAANIRRPVDEQDCAQASTRWSFGPTNALISVHLANDVIEWLSGRRDVLSKGRRMVLRFSDLKVTHSTDKDRAR